jgi:hypothetical protein
MKIIKRVLLIVYGLQLFIVGPWFLGAMYRNEMSLWAWEEYAIARERHGVNDARFTLYLYIVFYKPHRHDRGIVLILASWFLITFFIMSNSIFALLRSLPNFWLVVLWLAVTLFISVMWRKFHTEMRKRKPRLDS